jgi:hypothetical protein
MIQDISEYIPDQDVRNISLNMFHDISEHVPGYFGTYAGIFWLGMDADLFWDLFWNCSGIKFQNIFHSGSNLKLC